MKKSILLLIFILLTGCALRETMNAKMALWEGQHFSELVSQWGPPQQIMPDGKGGQILTYSNTTTYTVSPGKAKTEHTAIGAPGSLMHSLSKQSETTYTPPRTKSRTKYRMFWVNQDGIIYRWAWKGL